MCWVGVKMKNAETFTVSKIKPQISQTPPEAIEILVSEYR